MDKVKSLVSQNKLLEAIQELDKIVSSNKMLKDYRNDVTSLSANFHRINEKKIRGTISEAESQLSENLLANNLLELSIQISISIKTGKGKIGREETLSPQSATGIGFILMPLFFLLVVIGIGGVSYYKFFHEEEPISIFGKVYDLEENNIPIKNARVEIVDLVGVFSNTDNAGAFEFEIKKTDKRYLEFQVNHENYETQSFNIPINPNGNNELSLEKFLLKKIEKAMPSK